MSKKLIFVDHESIAKFTTGVNDTIKRSNELIEIFETFQPWKKIESYEDFLNLIFDPVAFFDEVVQINVKINAGGIRPDPAALASIFGIDRVNYLNLVNGTPVISECKPCRLLKIKKGSHVITFDEFQRYEKFLVFNNGKFSKNDSSIRDYCKKFEVYTSSEAQEKMHLHFREFQRVMSEHFNYGFINSADLAEFTKKSKGLKYVNNMVYIDEIGSRNEILKLE